VHQSYTELPLCRNKPVAAGIRSAEGCSSTYSLPDDDEVLRNWAFQKYQKLLDAGFRCAYAEALALGD
jgi:hypothetical protein